MGYFVFRRLANFIITLFVVSVIVFAAMNVLPGDPALTILGLDATEDALENLRQRLGLNEPLVKRYLLWVGNALIGDFGISHSFSVPVSELIIERLPLTVSLAISGMICTIILAFLLSKTRALARDL